jgi:hypothetical protein
MNGSYQKPSDSEYNGGLPVGLDIQIWPFQNQIPNFFGDGNLNVIDFHHQIKYVIWN